MRARGILCALGVALGLATGCERPAPRSPDGVPAAGSLLPARVRRLSNLEYERSVSELVGAPQRIAERLPPDVRNDGFTINAAQPVPAAWAVRLDAIAREVASTTVRTRLDALAPCAAQGGDDCGRRLVKDLGRKAFRRPLLPEEQSALYELFEAGAAEGGFAGGAELLLHALLVSPSFFYVTELGTSSSGTTTLTPYEIASALSYTVRGGPPDEELLQAAASGELLRGERRAHHARRLLGKSDTRMHFRRFVLEWLEVDGLERTAKSALAYPDYERLKPHMLDETAAFVDEVMVHEGASIQALLTAGFASVSPPLARFYGLGTYGPRASLSGSGRLGLLQQSSFLAAHAHEDGTSPVKRGDFVMRKLLCSQVKRPSELGIEVVIPGPSSARTTRERFSAHVSDPACRACHGTLDAFGFTFENFDAMGGRRSHENGKAVDTRARVRFAGRDHVWADSAELSTWLAGQPAVSECFARHAFRYFSAASEPRAEAEFLALRVDLDEKQAGNLIEELVLFVESELFVHREVREP